MKWPPVVIGLVILALLTLTTFQLRQRVDLPQLSFGRAQQLVSPVPTPSPTPVPAAYARIPGTNLQYDSSDVLAAEIVSLLTDAQLDHAYFDAYANLQVNDRLDNDAGSDILTRAQADARYATISSGTTSTGTATSQSALQTNDLTDVNSENPQDGQILKYDAGLGYFTLQGDANTDNDTLYTAGNGLTLSGANAFSLGGTITGDVTIGLATYDWLFTGTGNLGVGTTAPAYKLDVNGDLRIAGGSDLYMGTTALSSSGGAGQIGVNSTGFGNSSSSNLQALLSELDTAITSSSTGDITAVGDIVNGAAFTSGTPGSALYFADTGFLGLGASAARLEFYDDTTDTIALMGGNVGIGTTTPTNLLTVNGSANVLGNLSASVGMYADAFYAGVAGGNTKIRTRSCADDTCGILFQGGVSNNTDLMFINNSGNVGIGTTDTTYKISVVGGTGGLFKLKNGTTDILKIHGDGYLYGENILHSILGTNTATTGSRLLLIGYANDSTADSNLEIGNGSSVYMRLLRTADNNFQIRTGSPSAGNLSILPQGNVGIGTTNPSYKLDISGGELRVANTDGDVYSRISSDASRSAGVRLTSGSNYWDVSYKDISSGLNFLYGSNYIGKFYNNGNIGIGGTNAGSDPKLFINGTSGSVGVGTTNPQSKLDINNGVVSINYSQGTQLTSNSLQVGKFSGMNHYPQAATVSIGGTSDSASTLHLVSSSNSQTMPILMITDHSGNRIFNGMIGANAYGQRGLYGLGYAGSPASTLTVGGNAAIGVGYNSVSAPENGLVVQGNVGIGTTSPQTKLHVNGGHIYATQGAGGSILAGESELMQVGTWGGMNWNATDDYLDIYTSASGAGTQLVLLENGSVGFGTKSPQAPIQFGGGTSGTSGQNSIFNINTNDVAQFRWGTDSRISVSLNSAVSWGITGTTAGLRLGSNSNYSYIAANGTNLLVNPSSGKVGIGTTDPQNTLHVNGTIRVDTLNSASDIDLCTDTNGVLSDCSSSLRYKENIADLDMGLDTILAMRPVEFDWQESGLHSFGFVAEEMQAIDDRLVTFKDGQIEGVKYKQLTAVLTNAVQELNAEVISLKAQNAAPLLDLAPSQPESVTQPGATEDEGPILDPADLIQAVIDWLADAANEVIIAARTTFTGAVRYTGETSFEGQTSFGDQVGQLLIPAGQTEQVVQFEQPFSQAPIVVLTPVGHIDAYLQSSSSTQFTVRLAQVYNVDVMVNWHAFPGRGSGEVTAPDLDQANTDQPGPETPTPTSAPDELATDQPTVTPTQQPTTTPTDPPTGGSAAVAPDQPEPTADPAPSPTPTSPESATTSAELSE